MANKKRNYQKCSNTSMNNNKGDIYASLISAHHSRKRALLDGNIITLNAFVGEGLVFISSYSKTQTRLDIFSAFPKGTLKNERMFSCDMSTRIYVDIGILIYAAKAKVVNGDTSIEGIMRSTTIYSLSDNGLQLSSQHQSQME